MTYSSKRALCSPEFAVLRGEQPETLALPKPGALRGDMPRSKASESEAK